MSQQAVPRPPSRFSLKSSCLVAFMGAIALFFFFFNFDVTRASAFLQGKVKSLGRILPDNRPKDPGAATALAVVKSHKGRVPTLTVWAKIELLVRVIREVEKRDASDLRWTVLKSRKDPAGVYLVTFSWEVSGAREVFKWKADINSRTATPFNDRTRWLDAIDEDFFTRFLKTAPDSPQVAFRTEPVEGASHPTAGERETRTPAPAKAAAAVLRPVGLRTPVFHDAPPKGGSKALPSPGGPAPAQAPGGGEFLLSGIMIMGHQYVGLMSRGGSVLIVYPGKVLDRGVTVERITAEHVVLSVNGQEQVVAISAPSGRSADGGAGPVRPSFDDSPRRRRLELTPLPREANDMSGEGADGEPGYRSVYGEPENRPAQAAPAKAAGSRALPRSGQSEPSVNTRPHPLQKTPKPAPSAEQPGSGEPAPPIEIPETELPPPPDRPPPESLAPPGETGK